MQEIPYDGQKLAAYVARPNAGGQHPAVILIHEIWGLDDHIKDVAGRLSREGYVVLAPDLFKGTPIGDAVSPELMQQMHDPAKSHQAQAKLRAALTPLGAPDFAADMMKKLKACFAYLKNDASVDKIGVMGFCFGGTYSFNLAVNEPQIAAAVPFYGHSDHPTQELSKINSPVLAFYGEQDTNLTAKLPELVEKMEQAGKNFRHKIYPGTGHAFFNDTNPAAYDEAAAKDAWQLTLQFLAENLL